MSRIENIARLEDVQSINHNNIDYLVYLSFHRELFDAIQKYANGKLLDIGCGNKPYEIWFKGKTSEYIGCDVVQSSVQKVDIICPANKIPLPNDSFDTIFSTQVIEHVEEHQSLINEAFRLLKKDGIFILSGPMYWYLHEEPYDFFRFTKHGFKHILEKSGFEIVTINENGGAWATLGLMINHTFNFQNSNAGKKVKIIKKIFKKLNMHRFINNIFAKLDSVDYNTINTINYTIVAKKK